MLSIYFLSNHFLARLPLRAYKDIFIILNIQSALIKTESGADGFFTLLEATNIYNSHELIV